MKPLSTFFLAPPIGYLEDIIAMSEQRKMTLKLELRQVMIEIGRSFGFDISGSEGESALERLKDTRYASKDASIGF